MKIRKDKGELIASGLSIAYRTDSTTFFYDDNSKQVCASVYSEGRYATFALTKKDIVDALKEAAKKCAERRKVIANAIDMLG